MQRLICGAASQQGQPQAAPGSAGGSSPPACSRRQALLSASTALAASAAALLPVPPAAAGAAGGGAPALPPLRPAAASLASGPRSALELADAALLPLPPGPIAFPRRQLELNFAVLQLRSGYEAVDDLDFIAMNDFQRQFWLLRQAEWEPYTLQHAPLRITQGQLSDPLYFDFITYSQAAAAGTAMRQGKQVFKEYSEASEQVELVTRDPALADNALLPARFFERQGERLYQGLVEGFRGQRFGAPPPCALGASFDTLLAGVQQILDIYLSQGYALKASLTPGADARSFSIRLEGPANLWSLQALAARRSQLYEQHDAAAVAAFLRASGRSATCRLAWSDTAVTQQWTLGSA